MKHAAPPVTIRAAKTDDAEAIARTHVAAWRETYASLLPNWLMEANSVRRRELAWARILGQPADFGNALTFVAESVSGMVGFGSCGDQRAPMLREQGFSGEFSAVYVLRSSQRQGVGQRLMTVMADSLRERGHAAAGLWVLKENEQARRFYDALGGEVVAEREERRGDFPLVELAYGWRDISPIGRTKATER